MLQPGELSGYVIVRKEGGRERQSQEQDVSNSAFAFVTYSYVRDSRVKIKSVEKTIILCVVLSCTFAISQQM
jgi:hypothetical protein